MTPADVLPSPVNGSGPNRRTVLKRIVAASVTFAAPGTLAALGTTPSIQVTTDKAAHIPADFTGLSYESSQLAHPQFFNGTNQALVHLFNTLGAHGVLRLGGNMSEFTHWDPSAPLEGASGETEGPDPGKGTKRRFAIGPHAIDNLVTFLDATQWRLIYGLNLARGKVDQVVEEATYVAKAMGPRLIALQFGNEPDLFKHEDGTRWTYEEFIAKWNEFYAAVRAVLPNVSIAGPDTSNPKWNVRFSEDVGHRVVLQTSHFYAEGPPTDPRMNIDYLLHPGEHVQTYITRAIELARKGGLPYRMSEGNTCYAAGKQGVSDTFASALWVVDFMFTVALSGAVGVNLHGGANGLYTPIAGSAREGFTARPIYYGMLLFRLFLGSTLLRTETNAAGRNVAAYAASSGGSTQVAVLNREPQPVRFRIVLPAISSIGSASVWRLEAPSIDSTSGVTFAKAEVTGDGRFHLNTQESLRLKDGITEIELAAYSAALIVVPTKEA